MSGDADSAGKCAREDGEDDEDEDEDEEGSTTADGKASRSGERGEEEAWGEVGGDEA